MPERLTPLARRLRREATHAERKVWNMLRERPLGFKFRRQQPIEGFIADFACYEVKLIIEIDGAQHFENAEDDARTRKLEAAGWTVIRFWNADVQESMDGVYDRVADALRALKHVQQPPHPEDGFQE
ncbi:endonuclease domain-containing protein [Hyphobacterium sp.]|uniref:endonuclease domain-containing protein n=1 Tax=Hyphobacterium sp. TaxID=2004662 RepID=UPI00374A3DBE